MNYIFEGKFFYFTKFCENIEIVKQTIKRCKKAFRCGNSDSWVSKRIIHVKDQLGITVYEEKKGHKWA